MKSMTKNQAAQPARRSTLKKLATVSAMTALGASGLLGVLRTALANGKAPGKPGIQHIKGSVTIDNTPATVGMLVKPGQTVTTGPGAEAVYILNADAFMQRENSQVKFGDGSGAAFMRVVTGKILSVFGKSQNTRQIATNTATIGIRGTGCYIDSSAEQTYFCLCYGEAEVIPTGDAKKAEVLVSKHHENAVFINAKGDKMTPTVPFDHTDAELTLLENSVGRWPAFVNDGGYGTVGG